MFLHLEKNPINYQLNLVYHSAQYWDPCYLLYISMIYTDLGKFILFADDTNIDETLTEV